jgi:hypothetical protein
MTGTSIYESSGDVVAEPSSKQKNIKGKMGGDTLRKSGKVKKDVDDEGHRRKKKKKDKDGTKKKKKSTKEVEPGLTKVTESNTKKEKENQQGLSDDGR